MKKASIFFALTFGLAVASWAGDYGIGASVSNNAYGYDDGTNTAGSNHFELGIEGIVPLASTWELDPYLGFFARNDKDDHSISADYYDANYKYTEFSVGSRLYYVTKISDQFRFLIGGELGATFGDASWDAQTGSDKYFKVAIKAPVSVEYRIVPNFGLRATAYLAALRYYQETWDNGSTTKKYTTTNFYLLNQDATITLGAYYFF